MDTTLTTARAFLTRSGLQSSDDDGIWTPLAGGVSSDLWRVDLPHRTVCVKGALARLRVRDQWLAPTGRNATEYAWLTFAAEHRPRNVPVVFAHDPEAGFFVMEYLEPLRHPVWKAELMDEQVDPDFAAEVGILVGDLHAASTRIPSCREVFATDGAFTALRLDPYFATTARRNPGVASRLHALAATTALTHTALVHGDVSPKNILHGHNGPILLDAECAWFGEPAFDPAFCLTHLLLKTVARPRARRLLLDSAAALLKGYLEAVSWEDPGMVSRRIGALIPALLLARVDGASPAEYLTDDLTRGWIRDVATRLLVSADADAAELLAEWPARPTDYPR